VHLVNVVVLVIVIVFAIVGYFIWDRRYRGTSAGAAAKPTGERFRDPTSGKMMRVYEDPATGKREYREEA
jgi:uncharacterized membrane protein YqiK